MDSSVKITEEDRRRICRWRDVQRMTGLSRAACYHRLQLLRDVLNRPFPMIVTIAEFKEYYFGLTK